MIVAASPGGSDDNGGDVQSSNAPKAADRGGAAWHGHHQRRIESEWRQSESAWRQSRGEPWIQ